LEKDYHDFEKYGNGLRNELYDLQKEFDGLEKEIEFIENEVNN
jgi:hypothetical protein